MRFLSKQLIVIVLSVVASLAPVLMLAPVASAATTRYFVCDDDGAGGCLWDAGKGQIVLVYSSSGSKSITSYAKVDPTSWDGHTAYEYKSTDGYCLQDDNAGGSTVITNTCVSGQAAELFWYSSGHSLVNDWATGHYGKQYCVTVSGSQNGGQVYDEPCTGVDAQNWTLTALES